MLGHESILGLELTIGSGALIQTSCIERFKIGAGALIQTSCVESFKIGAGAMIWTSCIERSKICVHFNWVPLATMDVGLTGIKDAVMSTLAIWHSATLAGIKAVTLWWHGAIGFISQRAVVVIRVTGPSTLHCLAVSVSVGLISVDRRVFFVVAVVYQSRRTRTVRTKLCDCKCTYKNKC